MIETKFNDNWKFWTDSNAFALIWNIPDDARDVTLPHDAMIEQQPSPDSGNKGNTGYRDGGIYNYVKLFDVPADYADKSVQLKFEGIYMNAFVYVNGALAGKRPYGYSTFYVELSDHLKYGETNEIRVFVRNGAMTNSRWYSGGGIYQDVYLLVSDLVYIKPDGVQIETTSIDEDYAVVSISSDLLSRSHSSRDLELETIISEDRGTVVAKNRIPVALYEQDSRKVSQRMVIDHPVPWSDDSPVLYTCTSRLCQGDRILDEDRTRFGIRQVQLDARQGLRINGRPVKLRGACIHHDSGLIGAATYDDATRRQVRLLKQAGFNAIRMSHHPASQSILRACDELGVYMMDEAFDMWTRCKSDYDYAMSFSEWWEQDIEAMVRKDFNHPSVIMYSLGNEIPEIGSSQGAKICSDLSSKVKALDSTRYTLASINGVFAAGDALDKVASDIMRELGRDDFDGSVNDFMSLMDSHMDEIVVHPEISRRLNLACAATDLAGYNYMTARYEPDGRQYPNRIIVGSETYPPEIARNWELVQKYPHVIGDFTWTGWDYIGEAGVGIPAYRWGEGGFGATYPAQLAYCGDIDITGIRRPASYYREIVFGLRTDPYITVQNPHRYGQRLIKTPWVISDSLSSWTYQGCEEKPVMVEIYSPGDEVELLCNSKSLGRKPAGSAAGYRTLFDTVYTPGDLVAVSYADGSEIGRTALSTAQEKRRLVAGLEDGNSAELVYIPIEIQDDLGRLAANEDISLELSVAGDAEVLGFGSANPKSAFAYNGLETETYQGRALLILKKTRAEGALRVDIHTAGYPAETLDLNWG